MYSPTTRLLTVLALLQSYKSMSGTELARRLEVNTRTVRRYIVMLQDMGIPVEAERGMYGAYQLQRGYKMPPLMFTDAEAVALTLGLMAIREMQFPVDVVAIEGALAKTERVMPENLLKQARSLQESIHFNAATPPHLRHDLLVALSLATQARQRVFLRYEAFGGEVSAREFDSYGIVFNEGYWYTAGYCHLRGGLRTFRLDRVLNMEARDATFERPPDFKALDYVMRAVATWQGQDEMVVWIGATLEQVQAKIGNAWGTLEATGDGVIFRRVLYDPDWAIMLLLMLDAPIKVIAPQTLKGRIREIAERGLKIAAQD